jgi:hypothetical protein
MALNRDEMQFWPGVNTAIVTEIVNYPQKKIIHVFLAAGDMNEVIRMLPYIEEHGKKEGCSLFALTGRKGWEKVIDKIYKFETKVYLSTEI